MLKLSNILLSLASLMLVVGCSEGDAFKGGDKEKKKVRDFAEGSDAIVDSNEADSDAPIARAIYNVVVKANTGLELCNGVAVVLLKSGGGLNPTGKLNCLIMGEVDLAKMFSVGDQPQLQSEDLSRYPRWGKVVREQNPLQPVKGHPVFTPPRPSQLGPIIQDSRDFDGFIFKEQSMARGISKEGQPFQSHGTWFMQVHETGSSVMPDGYTGPLQFNDIMKWEIKAAGFEGLAKSEVKGFESMTIWYNVRPISVPKVVIKSKLADIMQGSLASVSDLIFSGATITLNLREHQPL